MIRTQQVQCKELTMLFTTAASWLDLVWGQGRLQVSYYVKNLERSKRGRKLANVPIMGNVKHGAGILTGLRQTGDLQGGASLCNVYPCWDHGQPDGESTV